MIDVNKLIAEQIKVRQDQVKAAIKLFDDENTIPFIARYRKEATTGLDEEQLRGIDKLNQKFRALEQRREAIVKAIDWQGKLTPELQSAIEYADSLTALEDLYLPYRPKRTTRGMIARAEGLLGLAEMIINQSTDVTNLNELARGYMNEQLLTCEDVWAGARDIVAELINEHVGIRSIIREKALRWSKINAEKIEDAFDERNVYEVYYSFECDLVRLKPHQILAINRGETEKVLRIHVVIPERDWRNAIFQYYCPNRKSMLADQFILAIDDAAERLLLPAIGRDVRRTITEKAEAHAIHVFATNLRALLMLPPLTGHTVMGIDPGYRTGCKLAVVDPSGKLITTATIYPHKPQSQLNDSLTLLSGLIMKYKISIITIGNGTASRETEQLVAELINRSAPEVSYAIVNEAGASVYSASRLARAELPQLDVSIRGAVSIARRIQDPLAELVKIEPRSIGVGLYQHDINQSDLSACLQDVVESTVNQVGVDLATASPALLTYVAGIGEKLAERIVEYREDKGAFKDRSILRQVPGLGPKAYEQSAGFLRIHGGENPLDGSAIHPESYPVAEKLLDLMGVEGVIQPDEMNAKIELLLERISVEQLADELNTGIPTIQDILDQLVRPGRDPRQDAPPQLLRSDVLSLDDLKSGMRLTGTVRNVVDFGVFIDIGVKQDGLMHRSQIPGGKKLMVGDVINVIVLKVDESRGRIGLGWSSDA